MDSEPQRILHLLDRALEIFSRQGDKRGELLTLSHLMSIHISTTGYCKESEEYLERAERMFYEVADSLSVYMTILVARSLALSFCVLLGDMGRASQFSTLAYSLANRHKIVNFQAALLMVKGYEQIFAGNTAQTFMYLEQAAPYIHNLEVGTFNALGIRVMLFNFLFHNGDFDNYFDQRDQLISIMGRKIFAQSIAGPFCYLWEIDIALNRGRTDEAMELTEQLISQKDKGLSPHLLSQALQFKAFILATRGHKDEALQIVEESVKLRKVAKGNYFIALNKILTGLTYGHCGLHESALELLSEGIGCSRQLPTEYIDACGILHRASLHIQMGNGEEACRDLEVGLRLMRQNSYVHFWAWTPAAMQPILELAVRHGIEPARKLAAGRIEMALPDSGGTIPLLRVKTFGGLRLALGDKEVLASEDLTPTQRTLICLLVSSPGMKIGQEQVQLFLWPDSSQEKARVNFDTLLSRLRKSIDKAIKPLSVKSYCKLQKGILLLDNCRIDAIDFIEKSEEGLRHARLQEFWQAGNLFLQAHRLWQGRFVPEVTGGHQIRNFRDKLFGHLQELTLKWCEILAESDRNREAITIAEKALRYEPTNHSLVRLLYNLHRNSPVIEARQVLKQFTTTLQNQNYPEEEIAELVREITADSSDSEST